MKTAVYYNIIRNNYMDNVSKTLQPVPCDNEHAVYKQKVCNFFSSLYKVPLNLLCIRLTYKKVTG